MKIKLIPARPEHAEAMFPWRREEGLNRFNPIKKLTLEEYRAHIAQAGRDLDDPGKDSYKYAIEYENVLVGKVSLKPYWLQQYGELGILLTSSVVGKGIGTEAMRMWVDLIFQKTNMRRLEATCATGNAASWKMLERLGFVREGILREQFFLNNEPIDNYMYSVLRKEWQIAPATFSAEK